MSFTNILLTLAAAQECVDATPRGRRSVPGRPIRVCGCCPGLFPSRSVSGSSAVSLSSALTPLEFLTWVVCAAHGSLQLLKACGGRGLRTPASSLLLKLVASQKSGRGLEIGGEVGGAWRLGGEVGGAWTGLPSSASCSLGNVATHVAPPTFFKRSEVASMAGSVSLHQLTPPPPRCVLVALSCCYGYQGEVDVFLA